MNAAAHPDWDELMGHGRGDHQADAVTAEHLARCPECRQSVEEAKQVRRGLRVLESPQELPEGETHLSDDDIAAYVHNAVEASARVKLDNHLRNCGACMKEVLRTRAHRHAHGALTKAVPIAATTAGPGHRPYASAPEPVLPLPHTARKRRPANPALWGARLAASLALVAVTAWLAPALWQSDPNLGDAARVPRELAADVVATAAPETRVTQHVGQHTDKDGIDWYGGYIQTTAIGTADMSKVKNDVQAEIIAETTARHLAYAQLAELIEGVRISEDASYRDLLMETSSLHVKTQAFIRGAQVISKSLEWTGRAPRASVTLRVPLRGDSGLTGVIGGQHGAEESHPADAGADRLTEAALGALVIDARDLGYVPALQVSVRTATEELNLADWPRGQQPEVHVRYEPAFDAGDATVIKAKSSPAPGTIMITPDDAAALRAYLNATQGSRNSAVTVVF